MQIIGICLQSLVLLLVFVKCVLFAWFGMLMMCFAYWHSMLLMHAHHGPGHFTQDRGLAPPANGIPQARLRSECYSGRPGLPFHKQAWLFKRQRFLCFPVAQHTRAPQKTGGMLPTRPNLQSHTQRNEVVMEAIVLWKAPQHKAEG